MNVTKPDSKTRLVNGARLLGNLFRRGQATACGWSLCGSGILCEHTDEWCRSRRLWVRLALEEGRTLEAGEFGLAESFKLEEFETSGITLAVDVPEVGVVKIGGVKGQIPIRALPTVGGLESLKSVAMVLRAFPGSKVAQEVISA